MNISRKSELGKQLQQRLISETTQRQETDMHKPAVQVFNTFFGMTLATDITGMKSSIRSLAKERESSG